MRGGEGEGALTADSQHVGVDVGDGDVNVGVAIVNVGVLKHAEGDVSGTTGHIKNSLRLSQRGSCAGIQGGNEMVPWKMSVIFGNEQGRA